MPSMADTYTKIQYGDIAIIKVNGSKGNTFSMGYEFPDKKRDFVGYYTQQEVNDDPELRLIGSRWYTCPALVLDLDGIHENDVLTVTTIEIIDGVRYESEEVIIIADYPDLQYNDLTLFFDGTYSSGDNIGVVVSFERAYGDYNKSWGAVIDVIAKYRCVVVTEDLTKRIKAQDGNQWLDVSRVEFVRNTDPIVDNEIFWVRAINPDNRGVDDYEAIMNFHKNASERPYRWPGSANDYVRLTMTSNFREWYTGACSVMYKVQVGEPLNYVSG